jgi:hypothetical protein
VRVACCAYATGADHGAKVLVEDASSRGLGAEHQHEHLAFQEAACSACAARAGGGTTVPVEDALWMVAGQDL